MAEDAALACDEDDADEDEDVDEAAGRDWMESCCSAEGEEDEASGSAEEKEEKEGSEDDADGGRREEGAVALRPKAEADEPAVRSVAADVTARCIEACRVAADGVDERSSAVGACAGCAACACMGDWGRARALA